MIFGIGKGRNKRNQGGRWKERTSNGKTIAEMSRHEKKHFLSMDLIERMIRVEQKVSATFGKCIPYNETEYYKHLKDSEKKGFRDYLKKNRRKKFLLGMALFIPLVFLASLRAEITSGAIRDTLGDEALVGLLENISAVFIIALCAFLALALIFRKIKNRRFERHFEVIDEIVSGKHLIKQKDT